MANQKIQKVAITPIWKLALRFMISFGFILAIVLTAAELFRNGNLNAVSQSFKDGTWITFVGIRLAIITGYGFVMAFLTKRKAKNTL
ncbi:hypothetical protein [Wenyingzhuangia aestuarii]|uniref:hypothetical protein n=1 Tax=Wenyingzhuangia aestuarii TaxID=1647582 RepID=UPI00143C2279|nr:hypothetical protein [Wenyingzhuangia aestuarii]NJB84034.1 type II secretory pathway component PulF [Wenyingzhuangia aestuarii]